MTSLGLLQDARSTVVKLRLSSTILIDDPRKRASGNLVR